MSTYNTLQHWWTNVNNYILKGAVIENMSGDQPSVTVTFERPHISVKAYAVLTILNLLIMISPSESGKYCELFNQCIAVRSTMVW